MTAKADAALRELNNRELIFATYLAPCLQPVYEFVATRVGEELHRPTRLIVGETFDEVRNAEVDFAFLCGLPYVRLKREDPAAVEAIAAPIVQGERYDRRPVYFSDVIVPANSHAAAFGDLRRRSWAYNEPDSHSGYLITMSTLLEMAETQAFFAGWEMTGFHEESIRKVAAAQVEGSAVDSHVLGVELRDHPELAYRIRVICTLGPSTIQPLVATAAVPSSLRQDVTEIVTGLGTSEADRRSLSAGMVERFVAVDDSAYGDIRSKLEAVEAAGFTTGGRMSTWAELAAAEPDFTDRLRRVFDARRHKVLATLRRDGSPRVSGIEVEFADGELWMGMMPGSVKAQDLRRDPRLALHAASEDTPQDDPSSWLGDAKITGRAIEVVKLGNAGDAAHRFKVDVIEVVLIRVGRPADHLVIESWHEGRGLERKERK